MRRYPHGFKYVFLNENIFFPFTDKFLKFEVMEYLIHYVTFIKLRILFSKMKLKLGHNWHLT